MSLLEANPLAAVPHEDPVMMAQTLAISREELREAWLTSTPVEPATIETYLGSIAVLLTDHNKDEVPVTDDEIMTRVGLQMTFLVAPAKFDPSKPVEHNPATIDAVHEANESLFALLQQNPGNDNNQRLFAIQGIMRNFLNQQFAAETV